MNIIYLGEVKLETLLVSSLMCEPADLRALQGLCIFKGRLLRSGHLLAIHFASWDIAPAASIPLGKYG